MKLLFLGATPDHNAPGDLPAHLPAIALDRLPTADAAQQTVFAARLRASPVSTFVAEPGPDNAQFEQFYLVSNVALVGGDGGHKVALGAEQFSLQDYAERVSALVAAFNPKHRRVGMIQMTDPDDIFPMAIAEVQSAFDSIGFDLMVVMITDDLSAAQCAPTESMHYSLVSGLADRKPFGDGNGVSTSAEVETYLTQALNRQTERDPDCGPRYSVLLKSSNDPEQELVVFNGRSIFSSVETRLYNETFEAQFLMASENRQDVQDFLASCLYCPHERALTERLRDMEEFARASALEDEIWQRIKDDADPARLAIYLESCTLCAFEEEATQKISTLKAKAAAREAELEAYKAAASAQDLIALRTYAADCIACDHATEARMLISEIEADVAYQEEISALDVALNAEDVVLLKAYIDDCEICEGKDRASTTLERVTERIRLIEPCLSMAAVPQLGGPRQLREIEQQKAAEVCTKAHDAFPEDGEILISLGRVAQAGGDFTTASARYEEAITQDIPAAYGLVAYTHYAPPEGAEINLVEAERLAQIGASKGDWLSREILTVLYSKGLVPGRTHEEAFDIAMGIANEGNALGAYFVGFYYLNGTGVEADMAQAKTWLQTAVDQGYALAKVSLAEVYETADTPDLARAAELYWTAMKAGDASAVDKLTGQIQSRDREVIRLIQEKLNAEGAYRGAIDGIAGPGTVTAIQNYADSLIQQG